MIGTSSKMWRWKSHALAINLDHVFSNKEVKKVKGTSMHPEVKCPRSDIVRTFVYTCSAAHKTNENILSIFFCLPQQSERELVHHRDPTVFSRSKMTNEVWLRPGKRDGVDELKFKCCLDSLRAILCDM